MIGFSKIYLLAKEILLDEGDIIPYVHELTVPPQGVLQQAPPGEVGTEAGGVGEAPSSGLRLFPKGIPFFTSAI